MDDKTRNKQKILLCLARKSQNVTEIRRATGIHQTTAHQYLPILEKEGLVKIEYEGWMNGKRKNGRAMICSLTDAGLSWVINVSVFETLKVLSDILMPLKSTDAREAFRSYLKARIIKGETVEERVQAWIDVYEPFRLLLKDILILESYLSSTITTDSNGHYVDTMDPKDTVEKSYFLFGPDLVNSASWLPGTYPETENILYDRKDVLEIFLTNRVDKPKI
jgi:predicted ArsR family transcriptional regulator